MLCYNDGDLLEESIRYLLEQNHHLIVWDHGSTDQTAEVIRRFRGELRETRFLPRSFDFYELYPEMSRHLLQHYVSKYDWISWPDQDEFLEGPSRSTGYYDSLHEVFESPCDWIQFNNFNYWYTGADDPAIASAPLRIRHYSLFPDCSPRIRSWRSSATNIRVFNHNPPLGEPWPVRFNLRHYSMRSREQMLARLQRDRVGMLRNGSNYHYENMRLHVDRLAIAPEQLHYDDGRSELNPEPVFNWRSIYGSGAPVGNDGITKPTGAFTPPEARADFGARGFVSAASFWVAQYFVLSAWLEHAPFAFWLLDVHRPRVLVELGTHTGYSYLAFAQGVKRLGLPTQCFAIDTWEGDEHAGFYGDEVFQALREAHDSEYAGFSQLVRSTFDDAVGNFEDGSVDLLHIDGRHFYEDVKHDFETWKPKLSDRAIVLFHDTEVRRRNFGVHRLWAELQEQYPHFGFVHGRGLGVLGVGHALPEPCSALFAASADAALTLQIREVYSRLGASLQDLWLLKETASQRDKAQAEVAQAVADRERVQAELSQNPGERERLQAEGLKLAAQLRALQNRLAERPAELDRINSATSQVAITLSRTAAERDQLQAELFARTEEWRQLRADLSERDAELGSINSSTSWRITAPLRALGERVPAGIRRRATAALRVGWWTLSLQLPGRLRERARLRRDVEMVSASRMLDRNWYLAENPDVARAAADPVTHYLLSGGFEGRDPSPHFDSDWYLAQNADVLESGLNPLVHYLRWGKAEGRLPRPQSLNATSIVQTPSGASVPAFGVDLRRRIVFVSGNPHAVGHRYRILNMAQSLPPDLNETTIIPIGELPQRIAEVDGSDLVWIWRAPWSDAVASVIAAARGSGARVVFDIDDLLFRPELATSEIIDGIRSMGQPEADWRKLCQDFQHTMLQVDHVTTPTLSLAREVQGLFDAVTVIPNGFEENRLARSLEAFFAQQATPADGLIRIGYMSGTLTHQRDLAVASGALSTVLSESPDVRLVLWRDTVDLAELPELEKHIGQIEWRERVGRDDTPSEYARLDISIAPLEVGNPFCEAKSELKFFEAALVQVPTIASPTQPYAAAIRNLETGLLASGNDEWYRNLRNLVRDRELRRSIGRAAFEDVLWRYGPERRGILLTRLVNRLLAQAPIRSKPRRSLP